MGSAAVTLYHVEFDADLTDDETLVRQELADDYEATNLKVTKIQPQYEAGWYQDIDSPTAEVEFWSQQQVDEYGESWRGKTFDQEYRRMKDPEPWDARSSRIGYVITEGEFDTLPNGSVITDEDGDVWTRENSTWTHPTYHWRLYFHEYRPYTLNKVGSE
jgi:hypothetical protein